MSIVETDPVLRLEALWDGYLVPPRDEAIASADFIVTVTGAKRVVTEADVPLFKNGVILANAGHFPAEIGTDGLLAAGRRIRDDDAIASVEFADGRTVHVLGNGHMVNLAGDRPLGNSIESMDIGFALQARCLEAVARGAVGTNDCVVPVPRAIDEQVAAEYVAL